MGPLVIAALIVVEVVAFCIAAAIEGELDETSKGDPEPSFADVLAAEAIDAPRIGELIRARSAVTV